MPLVQNSPTALTSGTHGETHLCEEELGESEADQCEDFVCLLLGFMGYVGTEHW